MIIRRCIFNTANYDQHWWWGLRLDRSINYQVRWHYVFFWEARVKLLGRKQSQRFCEILRGSWVTSGPKSRSGFPGVTHDPSRRAEQPWTHHSTENNRYLDGSFLRRAHIGCCDQSKLPWGEGMRRIGSLVTLIFMYNIAGNKWYVTCYTSG